MYCQNPEDAVYQDTEAFLCQLCVGILEDGLVHRWSQGCMGAWVPQTEGQKADIFICTPSGPVMLLEDVL